MDNRADSALVKLKQISTEFSAFLAERGAASEADTRVKLVDRVLKEVCLWPESALSREDHVDTGFTDYQLRVRGVPLAVVEAKREGVSFTLPLGITSRSPTLNGSIMTSPSVKASILQVRQYCDDQGIKFAVATNGCAWIVFRAIRDDMPWKTGRARVFPSIEYIAESFVDFWNLLSYPAITEGSLNAEFGRMATSSRKLSRVVDRLFNADLPLRRNRLNSQLQPLIKYFFEDIAAQDDIDLLKSCYVHASSLWIVVDDLNVVINDTIPKNVVYLGTKPLKQTEDGAGEFSDLLEESLLHRRGELYLLLGGIGSGKTTFLKRYEKIIAKDLLDSTCYTFHLDFLQAPLETSELESFVWTTVLGLLRTGYAAEGIEERRFVKTIFKDKLANLARTGLRGVRKHTEEYEQAIGPYLLSWQEQVSEYVPKLLRFACALRGRAAVLFIDNVDQLDPDYQAKIFLLTQRITRLAGCISVIALREESYYAPSIQNTFTAFTTHKFHIASPQFRVMIGNRISYAIRALQEQQSGATVVALGGTRLDPQDISEFLQIVQFSVLQWSRRISRFIECICFGNMRSALQMFTTFLTSGATDVDKMLLISRRDGAYNVAFHEFLKSVMLQDRAYYKEDQSPILNLFNCTSEKNSSHFTSLRLLGILLDHRTESNPEGRGYFELNRLVGFFSDTFDDVPDVSITLDRLVKRQLIEANTRSMESVRGASHVRVTAAGWYYLRYLSQAFAYLDLVLQDTPLNDDNLERELRQSVYDVSNLSDREDEKYARMQVRFERTRKFLEYLQGEEDAEFDRFGLGNLPAQMSARIMLPIRRRFDQDRAYIESRLREGRAEDAPDEPDEPIAKQFELALEGAGEEA